MDPSTQSEPESTIPRLTLSHETPPTSSSSHSFDNGNTFSVTLTTAPLNLMPDDDNMVDSLDQVLQHGHALIAHLESGLGQIATCQLPNIEATDPFAWSLDDNNLLTCPFREEGEEEEDHMMSHDPQVVPRNLEIRSEVTRGHALSTIEEGQSEEHSSQSTPDSESEYVHLNTIRTSELERSPSPSPLKQRAAKGAESASTDIGNLQMSNGDTSPRVMESAPLIVNTSSDSTDSHDYDEPPGEETAGAPGNQATNEQEVVVTSMAEGDGRQSENARSREREEDEDSEDEYMRLSDVTLGLAQDHQASEAASAEGQLHAGEAEGVANSDPSVREGVDRSDTVSPTITVSNGENESLEVRESNHENMEVANGIDINTDASNLDGQESNLDGPVQQEPRALPQESNLDASDLDSGLRTDTDPPPPSPPPPPSSPPHTTSQQSGMAVLQPLSPEHNGAGLNEQYERLRRTLSHSRRRYSARRRNPRELARLVREGRGGVEESADPHLGSGDHLQTGGGEPVRRYTHSVSPYRQQQDRQRKTIGHLREIVNSTHMARDSGEYMCVFVH